MKLIKYKEPRDMGYSWFWVSEDDVIISSIFRSEQEANDWMQEKKKMILKSDKESSPYANISKW